MKLSKLFSSHPVGNHTMLHNAYTNTNTFVLFSALSTYTYLDRIIFVLLVFEKRPSCPQSLVNFSRRRTIIHISSTVRVFVVLNVIFLVNFVRGTTRMSAYRIRDAHEGNR